MSDEPQTPGLADVIRDAIESRVDTIYTAMPGRVTSFNAGAQTCSVRPSIRQGYHDEFGERVTTTLPVLTDVPVLYPGGGNTRQVWPLVAGDGVLLVICNSSIRAWWRTSNQSSDVPDAGTDVHHSLNDAIAIPGLFPSRDSRVSLTPVVTNTLVTYANNIRLGDETATSPVALKSDLQSILTAIDVAKALCLAEFPPNTFGATALQALKTSLQALNFPICATKVKAK